MFSLESLHRGNSNEYVHNIPFSIYKKGKLPSNIPNLQPKHFFLGTQERVPNSRGKWAISVQALEVMKEDSVSSLIMVFIVCSSFNTFKMHY